MLALPSVATMNVPVGVRRTLLQIADRLSGWPRRVAAAVCLSLAVGSALVHRGPSAASARGPVVVAVRDLPAGRVLAAGDVHVAMWPAQLLPAAAVRTLTQAVGRTIAAAMTAGEPITSARLRGRGLAAGLRSGTVATTVPLTDTAALSILQPGDLIDLIATSGPGNGPALDTAPSRAQVVAPGVRVLAVLTGPDDADGATGSLVIAVTQTTALNIAAAGGNPMTATLRAPP